MSQTNMNAEDRNKLKEQVADLVLTGYSHTKIANMLGISRRTVIRYVQEERKVTLEEMRVSAEEQMADMERSKRKRIKRLWATVLDEKVNNRDRHKAIQLLQNEEILDIKRKQLIGMLPPEAPQVAIQNTNVVEGTTTIADSIRRNYPELLDKFSKNKARVLNDKQHEIKQI